MNLHVATVLAFEQGTGVAAVRSPTFAGNDRFDAQPVRRNLTEDVPVLKPGDTVIVMIESGTSVPMWFSGGSNVTGEIGDHTAHTDPHDQYVLDGELWAHVDSSNPHPNLSASNIGVGTLPRPRLTGDYDINVTGSSAKWTTARTLTLAGSVTGSASIDGAGNVTMNTFMGASASFGPTIPLGQSDTDDNKDRGIVFLWSDGSPHTGFFGYDDSTGKFTFIPSATDTGGAFTGTKGELDAKLDWANVLNKPDPAITVSLEGPITGTGTLTLVDLLSGTITVPTAISSTAITLGAMTEGIYVGGLQGTANQVIVSGVDGEGGIRTLSLPQSIHTAATPTFKSITFSEPTLAPFTVASTALVPNLNAGFLGGQNSTWHREWANLLTKPDPIVTVALTGPVSGTASHTWTDLAGNVSLSIATTLAGGPGSGLNADLLDGLDSAYFTNAANLASGVLPAARLSGSYSHDLVGNVTGALTGNATTATRLQTARTIAGFSFDGTANITLATLTRGTYLTGANYTGGVATTWAVDATSTNTASKVVARDAAGDFAGGVITASRLISTVVTGTAPLQVASSTYVPNLNVQYLNSLPSSAFANAEELEALLGDLLYVGLYDADRYAERSHISYPGAPSNYAYVVTAAAPVDASEEHRVHCTVMPAPAYASLAPRVLDGQFYVNFNADGSVSSQRYFSDGTIPALYLTAANRTAQGFPAVGEEVHLRLVWDAATDTHSMHWRRPGLDLLDNTGWTLGASVVLTGKQVRTTDTTFVLGGAGVFAYSGKIYRATRSVNGTIILDVDTTTANYNNMLYGATSFVTVTGQTATLIKNPLVTSVLFSGATGNYLSVPDAAALDIVGDMGIIADIAPDTWTPATNKTIAAKWGTPNSSWFFYLTPSGALVFGWSTDGTNTFFATSTVTLSTLAAGERKKVAATIDVNNGATGRTVRFWTSDDGVTWTQLGAAVVQAGVTSIFSGAAPVLIGALNSTTNPFAGRIYGVTIRNGIGTNGVLGGTEPFRLDANSSKTSATNIYAPTGQAVTVVGTPEVFTDSTISAAFNSPNSTKPHPVWSGGPDNYRHGMLWWVASNGVLDFIDADLSGRYDVDADGTVEVHHQDQIIAIDPLVGSVGHEIGTDQPLSAMVFQYVETSSETLIKAHIREHKEDTSDPHVAAGYAKYTDVVANFMPITKTFDTDIAAAIETFRSETDPLTQYLNVNRGNNLYMPLGTNFDQDIQDAIADLRNQTLNPDPFSQYLNNTRADARYEAKGAVNAFSLLADPFPQYLLTAEADARYDIAGKVAEHEAKPDPHSMYFNQARGDARYALATHDHDAWYYRKATIDTMFTNIEDDVLTSDGAPSARVWIGSVRKPATIALGDIVVQTTDIGAQPPAAPNGLTTTSSSPTSITVAWGTWIASANVTSVSLEWSPNGTTGWLHVAGSPWTVSPFPTSFTDTNAITENTVRYYRLRASNTTGPGAYGNVTGTSLNAAPPAPTGLSVTASTATSLTLSWVAPTWADPGGSNARYEMFLNGTSVGFAAGTGTSHIFNGLTDNTTYTLGVRSRDAGGFTSTTTTLGPSTATKTANAAPTAVPTGLVISIP